MDIKFSFRKICDLFNIFIIKAGAFTFKVLFLGELGSNTHLVVESVLVMVLLNFDWTSNIYTK